MTRVLQNIQHVSKMILYFYQLFKTNPQPKNIFYFDYGYYYDFVKHAVCKHKCVLCVCQISVNIPLLGIKLFFL